MTLQEAIRHTTEKIGELIERTGGINNECVKEHMQLLDWLAELQVFRKSFRWIPASEHLPEEGINPITNDWYVYPVTFQNGDVTDIRYYKYGNGHWWHGPQVMDDKVIAWLLLPEPYKEDEQDE